MPVQASVPYATGTVPSDRAGISVYLARLVIAPQISARRNSTLFRMLSSAP